MSNDFFFDWHEHLYEKVQGNILSGKNFPPTREEAADMLAGTRVILCTLSMLSFHKIYLFTDNVPVETLIIDEASQIERGDLVPVLVSYHETLRKLVFVGDDNQLAPFGQDDLPKLESVFEQDVLRKRAVFLNTQYRMPVAIGQFISNEVYKGQLRSHHKDEAREACRFVDVYNGVESLHGHSWVVRRLHVRCQQILKLLYRTRQSARPSSTSPRSYTWRARIFASLLHTMLSAQWLSSVSRRLLFPGKIVSSTLTRSKVASQKERP